MPLSQDWVLVGSGGLILLAVCLAMAMVERRSARIGAVREVRQQFSGARILAINPTTRFCGLDRCWDSQWRGNGVLVLTSDVLYYRPWQRKLDITVPIDRIEDVAVSDGRKSGGLGRRHLQISYRGMDNQLRVATWRVGKAHQWAAQVRAARKRD